MCVWSMMQFRFQDVFCNIAGFSLIFRNPHINILQWKYSLTWSFYSFKITMILSYKMHNFLLNLSIRTLNALVLYLYSEIWKLFLLSKSFETQRTIEKIKLVKNSLNLTTQKQILFSSLILSNFNFNIKNFS